MSFLVLFIPYVVCKELLILVVCCVLWVWFLVGLGEGMAAGFDWDSFCVEDMRIFDKYCFY